MHINHHGQEIIKASEETVWNFITDSNQVSRCLPDVDHIKIKDKHSFEATIGVNMGPIRGKLKFFITLEPQREENKMIVRMQGGGPGVNINLTANADIIKQSNEITNLHWNGQAEVRGPATIMGGKMLEGKAKDIIAHVFKEIGKNINSNLA